MPSCAGHVRPGPARPWGSNCRRSRRRGTGTRSRCGWSWPMPRRTSLMSAPSRSQRLAISLMKLILVASRALATYLVISALSGDMTRNGLLGAQERGVQLAQHVGRPRAARTPTTTRSGFMKSSIAAPSLRNSGLLATSHVAAGQLLAAGAQISALVPTGTVLLMTTMASGAQVRGDRVDRRPTALDRSAAPSSPCGVPTARKTSSAVGDRRGQVGGERAAARPRRCAATSSARPGS